MRSKVVSLQVGNFHVGKSWQLESERFTCLREGGGLCWAPQHMLGSTIYDSFSDVGENRVYFASKILTPCRMH